MNKSFATMTAFGAIAFMAMAANETQTQPAAGSPARVQRAREPGAPIVGISRDAPLAGRAGRISLLMTAARGADSLPMNAQELLNPFRPQPSAPSAP